MQEANEKAIADLTDKLDIVTRTMDALAKHTIDAMDAITRLANATAANTDQLEEHDKRIERLEDGG